MKNSFIKPLIFFLLAALISPVKAQQIAIPRIDQMPDFPQPYEMRDWKTITHKYDSLVFDQNLQGEFLPLIFFREQGVNYPATESFGLHTAIGTNSPLSGEAINVLPALVGASLTGIDKSNQFGKNWALMAADYFNKRPQENIYLNHPNASSGNDWWYETMPNIFYLQLRALYPDITRFDEQLELMANQWLKAVEHMGGSAQPWQVPDMNFRAWNMTTMQGLDQGVPEPEAAGAIGWILYQTYKSTGKDKYRIGAEQALDFLNQLNQNPSYELQLPYGVYAAARINAEQNYPQYDVEKMLNWVFNRGTLRDWGTIVGNWGGYDVSGLVGEANDAGNDYAFLMNGFQQAAALVPLVRYDERFAADIAKWVLNLANASRLFYRPYLPETYQDNFDWSVTYDQHAVIGYEALKEVKHELSPYATGDAIDGGWAQTNLMLYGSSHVGYLAGLIEETNVEGILKLDLLKTDFYKDQAYPTFLLYNPHEQQHQIEFQLESGNYSVYDMITNQLISTAQQGTTSLLIPAKTAIMPVVFPSEYEVTTAGKQTLVNNIVIDFNNGNPIPNYPPRIRALAAPDSIALQQSITIYCTAENPENESLSYEWKINDSMVDGNEILMFSTDTTGNFQIQCKVTDAFGLTDSSTVNITAVTKIPYTPEITGLIASPRKTEPLAFIQLKVTAIDQNDDPLTYLWTDFNGNSIGNTEWINYQVPSLVNNYWIFCEVTDSDQLSTRDSIQIMVRQNESYPEAALIASYWLDGNANDQTANQLDGTASNSISWTENETGHAQQAAHFDGNSARITLPASSLFNFDEYLSITFKFKLEGSAENEQFLISHGSWQNRYKISRSANRIRFTINTVDGIVDLDSETIPESDQWYHLAAVYNGEDMEIWLDGALDAFKAHSGLINQTTYQVVMGQQFSETPGFNFEGSLDNVSIYNYPLNPQQVEASRFVSLTEISGTSEIRVFPNPNRADFIMLSSEEEIVQPVSILFSNILGQQFIPHTIEKISPNLLKIHFPKDFSPGIYQLLLRTNEKNYSASFICTP
jgi:hypothetical protein